MTASQGRVLVVEDDENIRQVVSLFLESEGFGVETASDGRAALAAVETGRPDVILLDVRMPVMDGLTFAEAYRELPGPHAPLIAFVAASDAAQTAVKIGAAGVLAKPFDLDDLLRVVSQHVS